MRRNEELQKIAYPEINVYHQLKNTQDISWGDPQKKGDIAFDFAHQIEDCKERNEAFSLKLVHSANKAEIDTKILDAIEEIEYYVRGKMFYCRFGNFTGLCPWPDEMEERIISNHPTTKMELFMLIK